MPCAMSDADSFHGTTILAVRHQGQVALAGDGQVTHGQTVVKHHAKKIQRLHNAQVLAGFAGSTADALALIHRFEARLEEFRGNLQRAAVELAKEWRTDRGAAPARGLPGGRRPRGHLPALGRGRRDRARRRDRGGRQRRADGARGGAGPGAPRGRRSTRPTIAREALRIASEICIYTNDADRGGDARGMTAASPPSVATWRPSRRARSWRSSTAGWSARRRPSARSRSRCAAGSGAGGCRPRSRPTSRPRTS